MFWRRLDALLERSQIVIDRPKGAHHPRFQEIVYALDYGYLDGTTSADGEGVDVWLGSEPELGLNAVICTVDLDIPNFFAAARTVAPVSIMYTANSQARSSMVSDMISPPMLCATGKYYERRKTDMRA